MNDLDAVVRLQYERKIQLNLEKQLTVFELANMELQSSMPDGTTINFPRLNYISTQQYTKYTDVAVKALDTENQTLVINRTPMVVYEIDDIDVGDNYINIAAEAQKHASYNLKLIIDGDFFNLYDQADNFYDNRGLNPVGGTAAPIALVTGASQNVTEVYGISLAALMDVGADVTQMAIVCDPFQLQDINTVAIERNNAMAGDAYKNKFVRGYRGTFLGAQVYVATNLTSTATLDFGSIPTAGDQVVIKGVTFTFRAVPALAGEVDIAGDAPLSLDNLVAAINGTGTPSATTYIELTAEDRYKMTNFIAATDGATSMAVESKNGFMNVGSAMTAAADDWSAETIHNLVMEKDSIHMVLRDNIRIAQRWDPLQLVQRWLIYSRYGIAVFKQGSARMVDVRIQAKAAQA